MKMRESGRLPEYRLSPQSREAGIPVPVGQLESRIARSPEPGRTIAPLPAPNIAFP